MNTSAEKLLTEARDLALRGEEFYRQAVQKIVAAKEADSTLTNTQIAESMGRSRDWVSRILGWAANDDPGTTPFGGRTAEEKGRGTVAVRRMLTEAPLEQVEQIIAELPRERQKQVAAAAGHEYLKARSEFEDSERNLTQAQREERKAAAEAMTQPVRQALGGFQGLGIAGHIEQATEDLRELVSDSALTAETLRIVLAADADWRRELQVAAAMVGLEVELEEV